MQLHLKQWAIFTSFIDTALIPSFGDVLCKSEVGNFCCD